MIQPPTDRAPSGPLNVVVVPTPYWQKARELLTTAEQSLARTAPRAFIVTFKTEDDARTFTHLMREVTGALLPVTDGKDA